MCYGSRAAPLSFWTIRRKKKKGKSIRYSVISPSKHHELSLARGAELLIEAPGAGSRVPQPGPRRLIPDRAS